MNFWIIAHSSIPPWAVSFDFMTSFKCSAPFFRVVSPGGFRLVVRTQNDIENNNVDTAREPVWSCSLACNGKLWHCQHTDNAYVLHRCIVCTLNDLKSEEIVARIIEQSSQHTGSRRAKQAPCISFAHLMYHSVRWHFMAHFHTSTMHTLRLMSVSERLSFCCLIRWLRNEF